MTSVKGKVVGYTTKHVAYNCPHCGARVCEASTTSSSGAGTAVAGAAVGFALGGPIGAIVGLIGGAALTPNTQICPTTGRKYKVET